MSRLAKNEDLLERAIEIVRDDLQGLVEGHSSLRLAESGEIFPEPGTFSAGMMPLCEAWLQLIRDAEAEIGRFEEHRSPQWLDDLVDGKWKLRP